MVKPRQKSTKTKTKLPRRFNVQQLQNSRSPITPDRESDNDEDNVNPDSPSGGKRDEIKTLKNIAQKVGIQFNEDDAGESSKEMRNKYYDRLVTSIAGEDDEVPAKIARLTEQRKVKENAQDLKTLNRIHKEILRGRFDSIMKITPSDLTKIFDYLHLGPQPPSPKIQDIMSSKWYPTGSNLLYSQKETQEEGQEDEEQQNFDVGVLKHNIKYLKSLESSLSIPISLKILNTPTTTNDDADEDENATKEKRENLSRSKNGSTIASLKNDIQELEKEQRQLKILKDGARKVLKELGSSNLTTNSPHELPDLDTLKGVENELLTKIEVVLEHIKDRFKIRTRSIETIMQIFTTGKVSRGAAGVLCPEAIEVFMNRLQILRIEKTSTKSQLKLNDFS